MSKVYSLQTSFTAGVLDPRMAGRTDVRQYYQGMSVGTNVVTVPLGGVRRRPGLKYLHTLPPTLTRLTGMTITAPNGGTTAQANDDDEGTAVLTTVNIGTTDDYVIVHYDLGAAQTVLYADVVGAALTAGTGNFEIHYSSDNSNWSIYDPFGFGGALPVTTTKRTFRKGNATGLSRRYWRVVRAGTADLGSAKATIDEFTLWVSAGGVSEVRLLPFERSATDRYVIALTDRTAYVVQDDEIVIALRTPYASADLAEVDHAPTADVMIVVHEDHAPLRLVRETSTNWQLYGITFTGVPDYDYNDADSPTPTSDVQTITFTNFTEGDLFQLELDGARTGSISYQGVASADKQTATAANIAREVQKLYTVGFTGVSCVYSAPDFVVTLAGESADAHPTMVGSPVSTANSAAAITVVHTTTGSPRREDVWSETRGWPRTVTFHEGRLWFGGTRSIPQSYLGSVVNDYFNFETGDGRDDEGVFGVMNTAQLNAVTGMKSGRFLCVMTTGGEFRFISSPITPADAPRNQTEYGAAQVKPVAIDGAVLFLQRGGKVLRDFLYRYEEDAYSSVALSVLASHLISAAVDMTAYQGSGTDDANYVYIVNGDGTVAVYNTLRAQEIAAFTKWTTDGLFKAVAAVGEDRYFAVRRTINGTANVYLEIADENYYLDCAGQQAASFAGTTLVGQTNAWDHLIGEELRVRADGFVLANNTPNVSGNMTLEIVPDTLVEAGLDWTPTATTMPLNSDFGNGGNFLRKKRIVKARILVTESLGLLYNGRVLADRYWDLDNFDAPPDPFTGAHSLEETSNWDEGTLTQTISQTDPLPFHILAAEFQVETT